MDEIKQDEKVHFITVTDINGIRYKVLTYGVPKVGQHFLTNSEWLTVATPKNIDGFDYLVVDPIPVNREGNPL